MDGLLFDGEMNTFESWDFSDTLDEQHKWEICHLGAIACWRVWRSVWDFGQGTAKEEVVDSGNPRPKAVCFSRKCVGNCQRVGRDNPA